jgi:glycosyltransferase involved in cell wall biosynthesis
MIIRGWMASGKARPLVLVGNPANAFGRRLVSQYRHERLRFIGAIYDGPVVAALRHYSALYLHGHSVGGTNPSLLEAMACGCTIAAHDNAFNRAVLNEEGFYFSTPAQVQELLDQAPHPATHIGWKEKNLEKVKNIYNWDQIVTQYEAILMKGAESIHP